MWELLHPVLAPLVFVFVFFFFPCCLTVSEPNAGLVVISLIFLLWQWSYSCSHYCGCVLNVSILLCAAGMGGQIGDLFFAVLSPSLLMCVLVERVDYTYHLHELVWKEIQKRILPYDSVQITWLVCVCFTKAHSNKDKTLWHFPW